MKIPDADQGQPSSPWGWIACRLPLLSGPACAPAVVMNRQTIHEKPTRGSDPERPRRITQLDREGSLDAQGVRLAVGE